MRQKTRGRALAGVLVGVAVTVMLPTSTASADASSCEPATRVVPASHSWPLALSAAGHVVTGLYNSETEAHLSTLHAPDGTQTDLVDGDRQLDYVADVNSRGIVVGTDRIYPDLTTVLYEPWIFRDGRVDYLATPGKQGEAVRKDYLTLAVSGRSVVGLKTNRDRYDVTDPAYVAHPVLWPTPRSTPVKLPMPDGYYGDASGPLLDILGDGSITGIVRDRAEGNRYFAMWATPASDPILQRLSDMWIPEALSGQWVEGRIFMTGDVFVRSWTEAYVVDSQHPQPLWTAGVSANGTFVVTVYGGETSTYYVGSTASGTVHELGIGVGVVRGVTGSLGGQVLLRRNNVSIEVVTCALGLPEQLDVTVTPYPLT